jgi:4-hydroxybenzoate polyprenyltransferase
MVTKAITRVHIYLDAIKFEHTIFALPFAYLGMLLAAHGLPSLHQFIWITLAMVGARSLALALNRLIDAEQDAHNPRTAGRALPRGLMRPQEMGGIALAATGLLFISAWQLNTLCLALSPVAVGILGGYSFTKRFTWLCHFILGIADGIAPIGGWLAVNPTISPANLLPPLLLGLAVALWVGGFDLIYSCQDIAFDRANHLYSIPACFGSRVALRLSAFMHAGTIGLLLTTGIVLHLMWIYWVGLTVTAVLIVYEHYLVDPHDFSRLHVAFFNINGYIAVVVFAFTAAAIFI